MNAIIGFARLVLRRAKDVLPKREHKNLGKILISAEHLLSLSNNILDLAKIEAGHLEVSSCSFALEPLVKNARRRAEEIAISVADTGNGTE